MKNNHRSLLSTKLRVNTEIKQILKKGTIDILEVSVKVSNFAVPKFPVLFPFSRTFVGLEASKTCASRRQRRSITKYKGLVDVVRCSWSAVRLFVFDESVWGGSPLFFTDWVFRRD